MFIRIVSGKVELSRHNAAYLLEIEAARRLRGELERAIFDLERPASHIPIPISDKARTLLNFVHLRFELDRVSPTRQAMAEHLGFADKKSLLPLIAELEQAGWVAGRDGHRSDDWGGQYQRPLSPPFGRAIMREGSPQKGECPVAQGKLF